MGDQITENWIKGIRRGWKRLYDRKDGQKSPDEKAEYVERVDEYLKDLYEDLAFNKGLYPYNKNYMFRDKDKSQFTEPLEEARTELNDLRVMLDYAQRRDGVDLSDEFRETLELVDKKVSRLALGRLTRHLEKLQEGNIDRPEIPKEFALGDVKVVYTGLPGGDAGKAEHLRDLGEADFDPRRPRFMEEIMDALKEARSLLRGKGLDKLWHGVMKVEPGSLSKGTAVYSPNTDQVRIFAVSSPRTIVHELGHRYWYKHMSKRQREKFRAWFGDVPATTDYGSTNPEEDFAEAFADYVTGRDMTREQVDRFKSVLRDGDKVSRRESLIRRVMSKVFYNSNV